MQCQQYKMKSQVKHQLVKYFPQSQTKACKPHHRQRHSMLRLQWTAIFYFNPVYRSDLVSGDDLQELSPWPFTPPSPPSKESYGTIPFIETSLLNQKPDNFRQSILIVIWKSHEKNN